MKKQIMFDQIGDRVVESSRNEWDMLIINFKDDTFCCVSIQDGHDRDPLIMNHKVKGPCDLPICCIKMGIMSSQEWRSSLEYWRMHEEHETRKKELKELERLMLKYWNDGDETRRKAIESFVRFDAEQATVPGQMGPVDSATGGSCGNGPVQGPNEG